ncbi:MAG: PAS domain S-box protein [Ginsengibacter sp.]
MNTIAIAPTPEATGKGTNPLYLLVVEDNPGDYFLLMEYLQSTHIRVAKTFHAERMADVPGFIRNNHIDLVLLDLTLPDSKSIDSVITIDRLLPKTPIVVFSGVSSTDIAMESISLGAQDYLIKGEFDEKLLAKSIQYSIERKKTLENLRESNERYEFVNKATLDTIWEWDFITKKGIWGAGLVKIFGYPEEDLQYENEWIKKYIHPEDLDRVGKNMQYHISNGLKNWQDEYRFLCADNSYKYVYDRGFIIFDTKRLPSRMFGAMMDITDRRQAELNLVESENHLRTIIQSEPECIKLLNKNNEVLEMNPAGLAMIEADNIEQVIGNSFLKFIKPKYINAFEKLTRDVFNDVTGKLAFEITGFKGKSRWLETHSVPMKNVDGEVMSLLGIARDITESKEAEKALVEAELKYRTLFEQSADGISVVDPETLLPLDFNEKMHTQLGYSREEFARLKISDYEMIYSPEIIKERKRKIILHGRDNFETMHKKKNGEIRNVQVNILSIILHGKPQFYATYQDITEKIKLEKELKQQEIKRQRQIMEATISGQEKEKHELSLELHDNISQMLATVKLYLGMLKSKETISDEREVVEQSYDYLNIAMEELRKLSHSLAAPSLGDKGIHEALNKLLEEINATSDFKMTLVDEMKKEQPIDDKKALMLYRITQEQMNNIHKYAHAKNVIIQLKVKDAQLELSITDDGVGFDTSKKAAGIGLKNIQSRVEFYSGNVNIISAPGEGCKIIATIPLLDNGGE